MSDISDYLRKIITMRYGYELKMTEIADILGKDSATIRKQMERARKYLAEKLENVTEDIRLLITKTFLPIIKKVIVRMLKIICFMFIYTFQTSKKFFFSILVTI